MKKLFTLLTLLVMCVTGAWGEDPTVTVTWFPSTMTSENFSVAGTSSVTGLMTVNNATHSDPVSDPVFRNKNVGSTTTNWAKFTSSNVNVNGSNKNRWLASDYITFSVTIADGVIFTPTSLRATVAGSGTGGCGAGLFETKQNTAQSGQDNGIPKEENGGQTYTVTSFTTKSYTGGQTMTFYIHIGIPSTKAISVNNVTLEGTYAIESTDPATAPTFDPNGGGIDGNSTITIGSDATHTYYQWSDTEVTLTKDSEGWLEGKSVTAPNVTSTKYLYAYATNGDGLESSVVSKAFNITKVKLSNGLAYATDAVTKKVGNAAFTNPLTNPNGLSVTYSIADGATATGTTVNAETGEVTLGETAGTATIKAVFVGNDEYLAGEATYTLTVTDPNKVVSGNAYYIGENETPVPDESIICNDITMTFVNGKAGESFTPAVADNHINSINSNYNYSISGSSGNNGWKAQFVPTVSGVLKVGVIINNNKTFSITNVTSFSYKGFNNKSTDPDDVSETISGNSFKTGETTEDKLYVEVTINAVAGTEYAFSVAGSKMGFYGFEFTPVVSGTITASGYNTYSTNYPVDLSTITGGTAYVATSVTDGKVVLTKCTSKVPAATGLFIAGKAGETFTISTTADETSAPATNLLVAMPNGGTVSKADEGKFNYVFGWTEASNPGFYLINSKAAELAAFKAYLHTTDALSATNLARMSFVFADELTGVNQIKKSTEILDGAIYNLSGQRVAQPTKGLYIVNGKKYINQ